MYQSINEYQFRDAFHSMGRGDQFSYEALNLLFDYLEQYEVDSGQGVELDVIALCCEFSEDHYKDIFNTYYIECDSEEPTDEEVKQAVIDYLNDNTLLVGESVDDKLVYQQF
jgi:hypothetical protein